MASGIQIGTRIKTRDMEAFIYRVRPDGLFIIDTRKTDERIKLAARFLATFPSPRIVVVSSRIYGQQPVRKFGELSSAITVIGRFPPGALTNPLCPSYMEPQVVLVTDPSADEQALTEAAQVGLPVIAFCDTDNIFKDVDVVIPTNNKGRKALAMVFWLLGRQLLREKGTLASDANLATPPEDFETKLTEERLEPE